jgi:aspartate aminotransferase
MPLARPALPPHTLDAIPLGGIVSVRDRLLEMQARGKPIMRLESGDPSFAIPTHVREALEKALRDGHTHYTAGAGIPALRKAAWRKMSEQNRIPVRDPEHVLVTNGAMHGLYIAFRALVGPGDEIIVPDPTWTETADNVTLAGGTAVRVRLDASRGYLYDPEAIAAAVTPRTRAIVVNTPHNPTGVVLERGTLEQILAVAERHNLFVVSDEAYEHVIFDGRTHHSLGALPGGAERVISIFSMSKSYAMSGLRLGYLAVNDDALVERMAKLLRCTINGVNSATQHAGVAALDGPQEATRSMNETYRQRRDLLLAAMQRTRFLEPLLPQGAFYAWARVSSAWPGYQGRREGWAMTDYLIDEAGIGSAPGDVFGPAGVGHIRFAFSCPTEQVERAATLLPSLLG